MNMEGRTRIGLYFKWSKSWMGGLLYGQNLVKALNKLDDINKPFIDVYCENNEAFEDLKKCTNYPYLDIVIVNDNSFVKRAYRKIIGLLFGTMAKARVSRFRLKPDDVLLFPYGYGKDVNKLVFWKPDFQEKYLPELFTKEERENRDKLIRIVAGRGIPIVFSSYDSENSFHKFYPEYNNKTYVVHFAVDHDDFSYVKIEDIKKKYNIKGDYLLCANQFWKHKNHLFLFKAYKKALQKGLKLKLLCTGRLSDYRNPEYIEEIKRFIANENLSDNIIILGLIEMDELHCLMNNAYAIVQPSLFEGWNTTVEDCKALSKFIFLSNLPVHHEQISENVCFFDPHNEEDLAEKLLTVTPTENPVDYSNNLREFGESFLEVINYAKQSK